MPIQFQCHKCLKWLEVDEPHAGGKAVCPFCQTINDVPQRTHTPDNNLAQPATNYEEPEEATEKTPYTDVPAEQPHPATPDAPAGNLQNNYGPQSGEMPGTKEYGESWFDAARNGLPKPPTRNLGKIGFILTLVAWGLIITLNVIALWVIPPELIEDISKARDPQKLMGHPWIMMLSIAGMLAFATNIVGLSMCLSTLFGPGPESKRYATAGAIAGGILLLFACGSMLMTRV